MIYITQKQGFKYSALLDISKAFDKVDRKKLKEIIVIKLDDPHLNHLLQGVLEVYDEIKTEVQYELIKPTRGILQGSTYRLLLFTLYINDILTKMNTTTDKIKVQAFVDDLIIFSKDLITLEQAFFSYP